MGTVLFDTFIIHSVRKNRPPCQKEPSPLSFCFFTRSQVPYMQFSLLLEFLLGNINLTLELSNIGQTIFLNTEMDVAAGILYA